MELNYEILEKLSTKYGDAFYLVDSNVFRKNYEELLAAFGIIYPNTRIAYSYKTNYMPKLCRAVKDLGGAAEVVSEMELWLARKIGVQGADIYYNGPYKKKEVVEEFLLQGGHLNIDAEYEIEMIREIAGRYPDRAFGIGVRCNVDIGQETPSRFGINMASGELERAVYLLNQITNVKVAGLHCHIPFRTLDTYVKRMEFLHKVLAKFPGYAWEYISLGGGYMGKMDEQMAKQMTFDPPAFAEYAAVVAGGMNEYFSNGACQPTLIIEPGSALAADAMKYVMRVIEIKKVRNKWIASLAGSSYQTNPSVKGINRSMSVYDPGKDNTRTMYRNLDMAGYTCIESDYLYHNYSGKLAKGDFVVLGNVGSYSFVMKPPFILPDIPVLEFSGDGQPELIRRAQTAEDVFMYYE